MGYLLFNTNISEMLHNFILNASNDSKQAGVSGPWQLIKENNSGMALIVEHFPLLLQQEPSLFIIHRGRKLKLACFV